MELLSQKINYAKTLELDDKLRLFNVISMELSIINCEKIEDCGNLKKLLYDEISQTIP